MTSVLAACRPEAPSWFPDWSGAACAIVATGPSVKAQRAEIDRLRGRIKVIAIKEAAVDLCPWADVAYGCDAAWWVHRRGLPDFGGLRIGWDRSIRKQFPAVHLIEICRAKSYTLHRPEYVDRILTDQPGMIGSGRNSGFQAINLAVQFGAIRIMLIGFDLQGSHYYGRNNWLRAGNPDEHQFDRCRLAYQQNAPHLKELGVDVVNVSPVSTINCFRRSTIERELPNWC